MCHRGVGYEVERMVYELGQDRRTYIAKKTYGKIMKSKKMNLIGMKVVEDCKPKLVIEYESKDGRGVLELYDIGPRPPKPKKEPKQKKLNENRGKRK